MKITRWSIGALLALGCSNVTPPSSNIDGRVVTDAGDGAVDGSAGDGAAIDAPSACIDPAERAPADGPCRCNGDCEEGLLCEPETFMGKPRGRCLRTCANAAECGPGYRCFGSSLMQCNRLCTTTDDCGPARYCFGGSCRNVCQRDEDCFSGYCNRWSGRCEAPGTPPGDRGVTGDACLRNEDCRSDICLSGHCASACSLSVQGCPDGDTCIGSMRNDLGICYQICTVTADCRDTSLRCTSVAGRGIRACQ